MKKLAPFLLLIVLALVVLVVNCKQSATNNDIGLLPPLVVLVVNCKQSATVNNPTKKQTTVAAPDVKQPRGLNRHPSHINYSKHAQCRMGCRHIDASEIKDILENGTINYKKSELEGEDCRKKYAVEGYSKDKQHLRIIFAPCANEVTVVTCIDIGAEWSCDCK